MRTTEQQSETSEWSTSTKYAITTLTTAATLCAVWYIHTKWWKPRHKNDDDE